MSWNVPDEVIRAINARFEPDWSLNYLHELSGGLSGACLYMCQASPSLRAAIVKSFESIETAERELGNNNRARRQFDLPDDYLTEIVPLGTGGCFTMRQAGGPEGRPFAQVVKDARDSGDCEQALAVIRTISQILKRPCSGTKPKIAFDDVSLHDKLHERLQRLDSDLYEEFIEWWDFRCDASNGEEISYAPAHGDLHANNIFVGANNAVVLIDFGSYGDYPILKDFARLERDIRFQQFGPNTPSGSIDVEKEYLNSQERVDFLCDNPGVAPAELEVVVSLLRAVQKEARKAILCTDFEYDYIRFLEFLFFAASPMPNRCEASKRAAFIAAMALTKKIDSHFEKVALAKKGGVLSRLAYAFLRLEQLPSGAWARSLPAWVRALYGDSEKTRSKEFGLREIGGMNLTCMALLSYVRSLCRVLDIRPEDMGGDKDNDLLSPLHQIEERNHVCERVLKYVNNRMSIEGAIPASQLLRDVDTEVHHTLLGIIVVHLSYLLSGDRLEFRQYNGIEKMCDYLDGHGDKVSSSTDRCYEIYCAIKFLGHLMESRVIETDDPGVKKALGKLPAILKKIRDKITESGDSAAYPGIAKHTSSFLLNLPLLMNISGRKPIEENSLFTNSPLNLIKLNENGLVKCEMGKLLRQDWGHTAEYLWAKTRPWMSGNGQPTQEEVGDGLQTLWKQLTNQAALSLTHGVSFSYAMELCTALTPDELEKLDEQVNEVLRLGATERNLLSLVLWIDAQVDCNSPVLLKNIDKDQAVLEDLPPRASEIKNLFIHKLQPGHYIPTEGEELGVWMQEIRKSIRDTKRFFGHDLGERNATECEGLLQNKKWFHLFNYLGAKAGKKTDWVLDVGCGSGAHATSEFFKNGYCVHFFDSSERILKLLENRLNEKKIPKKHYQVTQGSVETGSLSDAIRDNGTKRRKRPYKVIFADGVLFHVGKNAVPEILSCFHANLTADGYLFVNFKVDDHTLIGIDGRLFEHYSSFWDIQKLIEEAGFQVEDLTSTKKNTSMYGDPYPTYWAHFICTKANRNGSD